MILKTLHVSNFRCFREANLELRPITLLTGMNSSGKSSIFYALFCALQTKSPSLFPFTISPNGEYCNLGSYREIVTGKNVQNDMRINLDFEPIEKEVSFGIISTPFIKIYSHLRYDRHNRKIEPRDFQLDTINFSMKMDETSGKSYSIEITTPSIEGVNLFDAFLNRIIETLPPPLAENNAKRSQKTPQEVTQLLKNELAEGTKRIEIPSHIVDSNIIQSNLIEKSYIRTSVLFGMTMQLIEDLKSWFHFIGPARLYPDRFYVDTSGLYSKVGRLGENFIGVLAKWKTEKSAKYKEVVKAVQKLELSRILTPIKRQAGLLELLVKTGSKIPLVNIQDAGYGLSQILPIIVADVDVKEGATILISQPELHLHPSCQADLANYFVSMFNSRRRRYVIETHSEYLLNRFKLLVAKGKISSDDIVIYHMNPQKGYFEPVKITIGENGVLENAPKNFFDTYVEDTFKLALEV